MIPRDGRQKRPAPENNTGRGALRVIIDLGGPLSPIVRRGNIPLLFRNRQAVLFPGPYSIFRNSIPL